MRLQQFNDLPVAEAEHAIADCCAAPHWISSLTTGRPYRSLDEVLDASDAACEALDPDGVQSALSGHPALGEKSKAPGTAASWSQAEQSGLALATDTAAALSAGQRAYHDRFGRSFLISAFGKSAVEILAELSRRRDNTPEDEFVETRRELAAIARRRLIQVFS